MHVHFLGTGDAFGSGGRLNTCFLVERGEPSFLIDCGASALISMRRFGIDPNAIAGVVVSHLHADHFGGLPFLILDAQLVSRREKPLTLVGPPGLSSRLDALMEAGFAGSSGVQRKFKVETIELEPDVVTSLPAFGIEVAGTPVRHPSGAPSFALRLQCDGRVLAYTGDTAWVEELVGVGQGADLLIAEAYTYKRRIPFHLDFASLKARLPEIAAKQVVLTHMSPDMLARDATALEGCLAAYDGMRIEV